MVVAAGLAGCAAPQRAQIAKSGAEDVTPARTESPVAPPAAAHAENGSPAGAEFGIAVQGLRLTGGGYFLDFRYRVTDPAKAQSWMDEHSKAYLIDQATGTRFYVPSPPKIGSLRQKARGAPRGDRTYAALFANPGRFVKPGAKVTVAVGSLQLENLIVE
jgi:hypothetical protein